MKSVTVFCGSSEGIDPMFKDVARALGETLADKGIHLIYGGARVGLMGAVADGALSRGGKVTGVLPDFLVAKEIAHEGLTELIRVESMHERKLKMHELSEGVIALPGGFGTLEEYFEILTWAQLGLHKNPVGLLNVNGFYDNLVKQADVMVVSGLLKPGNREMMLHHVSVDGLLEQMLAYVAPAVGKWLAAGDG